MTEPTGPNIPPAGPPALPPFPSAPVPPGPVPPGAVPPGAGYAVPGGMRPPPGYDPLISPDYSGWFQRSMTIVRNGWRSLAGIQAIGVAVAFLVQAPLAVYLVFVIDEITKKVVEGGQLDPKDSIAIAGYSMLSVVVSTIVMAIVSIAAIYISTAVSIGVKPDFNGGVRWALRRAFPLIGWQIIFGFLALLGFCLCFLPGLYIFAVMTVLPAVVLFERGDALPRCFRLFHGDLGAAAGRVATIIGITMAAGGVGSLLGMIGSGIATAALPQDTGLAVGSLISTLFLITVQGIVGVLLAPLTLTAYADLRARFEPLSTPMLCQYLGLLPSQPQQPGAPGF